MKGYQAIAESKDQASTLANKEFVHFLVNPATVALVSSEGYSKFVTELNMTELLKTPQVYELMSTVQLNKTSAAEFNQVLHQAKGLPPSFVEFASKSPEFVVTALSPWLLNGREFFTSLNGAAEVMASPDLGSLLASKAFGDVVNLQSHEQLMKTAPEIVVLAFQSEFFNRLVETQQLSVLERGFTTVENQ